MNKKSLFLSLIILFTMINQVLIGLPNSTEVKTNNSEILTYAMPSVIIDKTYFSSNYFDHIWINPIFAGLFQQDQFHDLRYQPVLASSYDVFLNGTDFDSSMFAMRVVVSLKHDLVFSDGTPLTADDVVFTYETLLNSNVNPMIWVYSDVFSLPDSILFIDQYTVEFNFKKQTGNYMSYLSAGILPQEIYGPALANNVTDFSRDYQKYLIGAGPFKLSSLSEKPDKVILVRNNNWVLSPPQLHTLVFKEINSLYDAIAEFNAGTVDLLDSNFRIMPDNFSLFDSANVLWYKEPITQEMSLNHLHPVFGDYAQQNRFINQSFTYANNSIYNVTSYWFNQGVLDESERQDRALLVREAMSLVINRDFITSTLLNGIGEPAATMWPHGTFGFNHSFDVLPYDVNQARQLMMTAGFNYSLLEYNAENDTYQTAFFHVTILSPNTNPTRNVYTRMIAKELSRIGINVTYINTGWSVIAPRTFGYYPPNQGQPIPLFDQGGYDIMFVGYALGYDPDFESLYSSSAWIPNGFNWYNWYDPDFDMLLSNYNKEIDYTNRINYANAIQEYLYKHIITVPIYYYRQIFMVRMGIDNLDPTLLGMGKQQWENVVNTNDAMTTSNTGISTSSTSDDITKITSSAGNVTSNSSISIPELPLEFESNFLVFSGLIVMSLVYFLRKQKR